MDPKSLLEQLEADLPDIQSEVIEEIINLRKIDRRQTQKEFCIQFGLKKTDVKKIFDRIKASDDKLDSEIIKNTPVNRDDQQPGTSHVTSQNNTSRSTTATGGEFSSVEELKNFFCSMETENTDVTCSQSLINILSNPDSHLETDQNREIFDLSEGEKLINHVKWFVEATTNDNQSFQVEKNDLIAQINNLRLDKDRQIRELTLELNAANASKKSMVCARCNNPRTLGLLGMHFCSVACVRKAAADLRGAETIPNSKSA